MKRIEGLLAKARCSYDYAAQAARLRRVSRLHRRADDVWRGICVNSRIWWEDVECEYGPGFPGHNSHVFQWEDEELRTQHRDLVREARDIMTLIDLARVAACLPPLSLEEAIAARQGIY
jgi:hypothetical protein